MVNRLHCFLGVLGLTFLTLTAILLHSQLPAGESLLQIFSASQSLEILLIQSYTLPRITIALLAGGILGVASLLLQQIMANPLASDNTLGISAGAQFTLFITAIFTPHWLELGASIIAVIGASISLLFVLMLAQRKTLSPLLLVLAGLVVNLYLGAFSSIMMLFYPEESRGLAQWGAGSLVQESWRDSQWLALQAVVPFTLIAILVRPFTILSLNDNNAQSLGVPVNRIRFIGVLLSAYLIACVVSVVGMLGFIGLSSATLVRQLGVRTFKMQLLSTFFCGALLLCVTDLLLQLISHFYSLHLPTGAVTVLLGTPLLLWLMFRSLPNTGRMMPASAMTFPRFKSYYWLLAVGGLAVSVGLALAVGKGAEGWFWLEFNSFYAPLFELRYPRMLVALTVGILLSLAGVLLQRLTLNPMASPELLGVSSGASMGVLAVLFLASSPSPSLFWLMGIFGALLALAVLLTINQRSGMLPEKVLLTGICLSALFDTVQRLAIASGDLRVQQLIAWTSGSTQQIDSQLALPLFFISLSLLALSLVFHRWLELLALQAPMAQALGLNVVIARYLLMILSALMAALATLMIGPLSFIGLLVPHITRFLGITKARPQLLMSALLGGSIMVLADWLGRQWIFPYEVPAGLVATLIGGGYFLLIVRKI